MRSGVAALLALLFALSARAGPAPGGTWLELEPSVLADLGIEIASSAATAQPFAGIAHGFALVAPSGVTHSAAPGDFEGFDGGALHHAGGLVLRLPDGEIVSLVGFVLRPAARGLELEDAAGWRWLSLRMAQPWLAPGVFELRNADVVLAPELAARLGRPELEGAFLGAAQVRVPEALVSRTEAAAQAAGESAPGAPCQENFELDLDVALSTLGAPSQVAREAGVRVAVTAAVLVSNVGQAAVEWNRRIAPESPLGPHPYLVLSVYRLASGRLEQIGRSDVKHAFNATNEGCECSPGNRLYAGCTDTYGASTNSERLHFAPRDELEAFTGDWQSLGSHFDGVPVDDFRSHGGNAEHDAFEHRLVVEESALETPGAEYWLEGRYVVGDDVDLFNNSGRRGFAPSLTGGTWSFSTVGGTVAGSILDELVDPLAPPPGAESLVLDTGEGRLQLAVLTTDLGGGLYHYEYALVNFDFDRQVRELALPLPPGANVSGAGFSDGDSDAANDWTVGVGERITWTAPPGAELDWGVLKGFHFDADAPPAPGAVRLRALEPGTPSGLSDDVLAPASEFATATLRLVGTAEGGSLELAVEGVSVSVVTSPGQTAAQVLAELATAIAADPDLAALGVSAQADGGELAVDATLEVVALDDPGLDLTSIPALAPWALAAATALLLLALYRRERVGWKR